MAQLFFFFLSLGAATARVDTAGWVGTAYTPSGASNTMWWPWFNRYAAQIDRELAAAAKHLKMNTLRVFLHSRVYEANSTGLLDSVDAFLSIAARHGFGTGLVLFDSCWNTDGSNVSAECVPQKGVHNGCWYESPEEHDKTSLERFRPYTESVVTRFGRGDSRVRWIEIYNEPRAPNIDFVMALRDAAFGWALALSPSVAVISCWDDNNDTQILDHHEYDVAFKTGWVPALYANPAKGAVITEGGSRWYQPPFGGDYGSPLTVINFLTALRSNPTQYPYIPGVIANWELMVGNSNTRWHWGSPKGSNEPAIPWDGWLFPSGEPVSYTEAAALRRYVTGVDEFLLYSKFLPIPPIVEDGNAFLSLPPGTFWALPPSPSGPIGDALFEASIWVEAGGAAALLLRAGPLPASPATVRSSLSTAPATSAERASYRAAGKRRGAEAGLQFVAATTAPPPSCAFAPTLHDTDVCSGGPPGYRDLPLPATPDPLAACAAACCAWDDCTAWIVRPFSGADGNCSSSGGEICCWLKPDCRPGQTSPQPGASSAFRLLPPPPPLPVPQQAYEVSIDAARGALAIARVEGGVAQVLGSFNTTLLENGIVLGAWNMLRVLAVTGDDGAAYFTVWFNPMFPETGFVSNSSDAERVPRPLPPRLQVRDDTPLPPGGVGVSAGGGQGQFDYISALPVGVL